MANRTVTLEMGGKMHKLARYNVEVDDPRPGQYLRKFIFSDIVAHIMDDIIAHTMDNIVAHIAILCD